MNKKEEAYSLMNKPFLFTFIIMGTLYNLGC